MPRPVEQEDQGLPTGDEKTHDVDPADAGSAPTAAPVGTGGSASPASASATTDDAASQAGPSPVLPQEAQDVDPTDHLPAAAAVTSGRSGEIERPSLARLVLLAVALVAACTAAAYIVGAGQPTVYAAEADLLFKVPGSSQEAERQLATQEVLLSSRSVLAPVAERFDVALPVLTQDQDVELLPGTQVLRLQVRNQDPDLAVRLAQAIADGYIASVSSGVAGAGPEQERELREQIADVAVAAAAARARLDDIASLRAAGGATPATTAEERRLQVEETTLTQRINSLQAQLTDILVQGENARPAQILTPAYLLDEPAGPRPFRAAAAGAMVGLVLAAGALLVALRRRTALAP